MSEIGQWIEERFRRAQVEFQEGRYDNTENELNALRTRIREEIQKIMTEIPKDNLQDIVASYRLLSELNFYLKRINSKLENVRAEKDRSKRFRSIIKGIHEKRIMDALESNKKLMEQFRDRDRTIREDKRFLKILRRWNSYTPLLCLDPVENLGGGYFLSWDGTGIAVDPGINFIKNAVAAGLSIKDMDIIVMTHSHVDHTSDFEGLVTLFHEINESRLEAGLDPNQFSIYASIGALNKYCNLISLSYNLVKEIQVLKPGSFYRLSNSIRIKTTPCQHNDLFCSHHSSCIGLKFYPDDKQEPILAITSDTGYNPQLREAFADLEGNLVILHIGGIKDEEMEYVPLPNIPVYKSHLGLRGVLNFIIDVRPSVAIISEFGEEFRGVRMGVAGLFNEEFEKTKVIPADIGLTIEFSREEPDIFAECSVCKLKVPISQIRPKQRGEALTYICSDCFARERER